MGDKQTRLGDNLEPLSKSVQKRLNVQRGIPMGVTCHYERIDGKWWIAWADDFPGDELGRKLVEGDAVFYLNCGYQEARENIAKFVENQLTDAYDPNRLWQKDLAKKIRELK